MAENKEERSPLLELKEIELLGDGIKVTLDSDRPITSGQTKYGNWYLWPAYVEGQRVYEGRGEDRKPIDDYTGKVVFFPTESLNKKLIDLADGNSDVEINIKKVAKENPQSGNMYKEYEVEKLSDGQPSQSSLSPEEFKLINEVKELRKSGFDVSKEQFVEASQEEKYDGKISEKRAENLYNLLS